MRGNFVPVLFSVLRNSGVPLKRPAYSVEGDWDIVLLEKPHDSPYRCPGSVVELRLGGWVPFTHLHSKHGAEFVQDRFGVFITIFRTSLSSFLIVEDNLQPSQCCGSLLQTPVLTVDSDFGALWPFGIRSVGAVAEKVSVHPGDVGHFGRGGQLKCLGWVCLTEAGVCDGHLSMH